MSTKQFIAVLIVFALLMVFLVTQGNKNQQRKKYAVLLDEAIAKYKRDLQMTGTPAMIAMDVKAKSRGYTLEEMIALDALFKIEQNGNVDERSGERIPDWLMKEYRKKYNKHD